MSEQDRQQAFEVMARMYPHEVAAAYPEQFRAFFEKECPGVDLETMNELLEATR